MEAKDKAVFEVHTGGYIIALDTGYFTVGGTKEEGRCNLVKRIELQIFF